MHSELPSITTISDLASQTGYSRGRLQRVARRLGIGERIGRVKVFAAKDAAELIRAADAIEARSLPITPIIEE